MFGLDFGAVYDGSKVNIYATQTTMKLSAPSWYGIQKLLIRAASGLWIHRPLSNSSLVPAATAGGLAWEHLVSCQTSSFHNVILAVTDL